MSPDYRWVGGTHGVCRHEQVKNLSTALNKTNQTQMHCRNGGFLHIWAVCRSNVVGRIRGPGRGDTSVPTTQPQVVTWAFPFLFQGHCQGNIILPRIFEVL